MLRDDKCPYCGSTDPEGSSVDIEGDRKVTQEMFCPDCYEEWTNVYVLTAQNRSEI